MSTVPQHPDIPQTAPMGGDVLSSQSHCRHIQHHWRVHRYNIAIKFVQAQWRKIVLSGVLVGTFAMVLPVWKLNFREVGNN